MFLANFKSQRKGVTLVEILIAFLILTLAAFGAAGLIGHGHKTTRHDFRRDEAIQLLVERMNQLSSLPFSKLSSKLDTANSVIINVGYYEGFQFGNIKIGNNTYEVKAELKRENITFSNLLDLDFSKPGYIATAPYTWYFMDRSSISFSGEDSSIIKIHVQVTPIKGDVTKEKTFEAVTFVCNME
ncbi:MAG: prepilin-type N-terminal cleavage/methylation domain-containing protein [Candidatus Riflebacteria bacterium]|nr:prepilin-type N-terminal cleavage/methylation domain-containing protein [Candidatus Riflebacteria bacterium]